MAHNGDGFGGVILDDRRERIEHPGPERRCGHGIDELLQVVDGQFAVLLGRDVGGVTQIELGDSMGDLWDEAEGLGERVGSFFGSPLWADVDRTDRLVDQIVGHGRSLAVAEVGQTRISAVGVVVDSFGTCVANQHDIHRLSVLLAAMRPTWCEIDLSAIRQNIDALRNVAPDAAFCAVVKANAYGHGAIRVAEVAVEAGANSLAVALVEEGVELREAGVVAPILLLSEPAPSAMSQVVSADLTPTLYTEEGVEAAATAAAVNASELTVEVCVDTGMRRVGVEPADATEFVDRIRAHPNLRFGGVWSHCAVADEPGNTFTQVQSERFEEVVSAIRGDVDEDVVIHLANSAVTLAHADQAREMVRCGIAMYGIDPSPELTGLADLRPALGLYSSVSFVKRVGAGEGVAYGHTWVAPSDRWLATVPIGYADGVRRDLGHRGGHVLIGGVRRPIVGVVTMDQLVVDLGDDASVSVGDPVVLIGSQGAETISAQEIADCLGTIPYEVLCAINPRVRREYSTT